ncbi:hypothetical protein Y032_0009g469 [Ancylostoma ceylanicum]|uniref:Uncharacterized protein n=3 Tax=Ancylostoma ceylanicum TaxID=53326 RepID=A0A016VHX1_9BILA|nr:hypothetical protein Y032_0009g469 [Ancylostoma ceylanicum]
MSPNCPQEHSNTGCRNWIRKTKDIAREKISSARFAGDNVLIASGAAEMITMGNELDVVGMKIGLEMNMSETLIIAASIIVLIVVIAVSIFALLFIRSKRAELQKPHRRRRAPKQEKPKPKAAKMKAAKIDMKEFKAGRLVMQAKFEGQVKHDLDDEQSAAISNVAFDPKQNSIAFIGTTIEKLEGQSQMTAAGITERMNPQDASQLKVAGLAEENQPVNRDLKAPVEERPTMSKESKSSAEARPPMSKESRGSAEGRPPMSKESKGSAEEKPSKSKESKESIGSAEGRKSRVKEGKAIKLLTAQQKKIHRARKQKHQIDEMLNERLVLLLIITACLIGAALVFALFLFLVSRRLPSIREGPSAQDLVDEKDKVPNDKKRQGDANAAKPGPNMKANLTRGKSYGLEHALDNDMSNSIKEITFDTDPNHVEQNGSSADYIHINAVYTPPKKQERRSVPNATANVKPKEEHPKVERKIAEEKPARPVTYSPGRLSTSNRGKVDSEPLIMPKSDRRKEEPFPRSDMRRNEELFTPSDIRRNEELFTTSDMPKIRVNDEPVDEFRTPPVQNNTYPPEAAPEELSDMRQMRSYGADVQPSPLSNKSDSRRQARKESDIFNMFED